MKTAKALLGVFTITAALAMQVHAQTFLTNGLAAYYPFNGNANDASGNGNNGTVYGASLTADRFGLTNSAYRFNGTNWIQIPDAILPVAASAFTISLWVLADSGPYATQEVLIGLYPRRESCAMATHPDGQWAVGIELTNSGWQDVTSPMITNVWVQLVGIYQQGQYLQFYVNGSLVESNGEPDEVMYTDQTFPLRSAIGIYDYAPGPYEGFDGAIDDVRIYNRALSESEVQQLYAYESTPPPSFLTNGLVAYYPFNGNANDASGNGNNGTVYGASLTADRFGLTNSAYRFNGTSWIQLPDAILPVAPSELTLSAWVLADSGPYTTQRF